MDQKPAPRAERRRLSHVDRSGRIRMVNVGHKPVVERSATAEGTPATTEERVEQVPKAPTAKTFVRGRSGTTDTALAVSVIARTRLGVAEYFVGARHLLEAFFGDCIAGTRVGMQFARELAVGLLQILARCGSRHAQQRVVVGHC